MTELIELDHISLDGQEAPGSPVDQPLNKLKRLMKKTYIDSNDEETQEKHQYSESRSLNQNENEAKSPKKLNFEEENVNDESKQIEEGIETSPINVPKKKKKAVQKREKKETNVSKKQKEFDQKRFISIFPDSNDEAENEAQHQSQDQEEIQTQEPKEPQENKPKRQRKKPQKKEKKVEFIELPIENDEPTNHDHPQENDQENDIGVPEKTTTRLKLTRLKKNNIRSEDDEDQQINSNGEQQEPKDNETDAKLNSLKKRVKKPKASLVIGEGEEQNSNKKIKKTKKKKDDEDGDYAIDENPEKPPKKEKKLEKVKPKSESTQEIFERMRQDNMFCEEEEDDEGRPNLEGPEDNHFGFLKDPVKRREKNNNNKSHAIIKTRNKFFREINTLDFNPMMEEHGIHEEEEMDPIDNNQMLLEITKKPKQKIDVSSFLNKFQKFKEERALDVNIQPHKSSSIENKNNGDAKTGLENNNPLEIKNGNETQNGAEIKNGSEIIKVETKNGLEEQMGLVENNHESENVLPRQGDFFVDAPDNPNTRTKNGSNFVENNENTNNIDKNSKKIPITLKQTPQELSRFLNNTLSNFSLEENSNFSLQISIPNLTKINSGGTITDTTLFVNKLARSNSFLNKSLLSFGGLTSHSTHSNLVPSTSNSQDRDHYKNKLIEEIRIRKSRNLNLKDIQDRFKQTDWSELTVEKQKKKEEEKKKEKEEDDESDDSDYNPNPEEEKKEDKKDEIDFKKMIELEEGVQPKEEDEVSMMIEIEKPKVREEIKEGITKVKKNEEISSSQDQSDKNISGIVESQTNTNTNNEYKNVETKENNNEEKKIINELTLSKISNLVSKDEIIMEEEEENTFDAEQNDAHTLKKLRKIAATAVINYEEERAKRKAEKRARYEAKMKDPATKAMMRNMFEMEAELGSDNEENDDVVKKINRNEDGERDSDEEMDEDLKDMIDNLTAENAGDNDLLFNKFQEDLMKQDKENLKKVLERAFNIKKRRSNGFDIGVGDGGDKVLFF